DDVDGQLAVTTKRHGEGCRDLIPARGRDQGQKLDLTDDLAAHGRVELAAERLLADARIVVLGVQALPTLDVGEHVVEGAAEQRAQRRERGVRRGLEGLL